MKKITTIAALLISLSVSAQKHRIDSITKNKTGDSLILWREGVASDPFKDSVTTICEDRVIVKTPIVINPRNKRKIDCIKINTLLACRNGDPNHLCRFGSSDPNHKSKKR